MCVFPLSAAEKVTAKTANEGDEKAPEVTAINSVPPTKEEVTVSSVTKAAAGEIHQIISNKHTRKNKVEEHHKKKN